MKKWHHKRGVVSHGGDILVLFYYLIASEIWPDKRGGLIGGGLLHMFTFILQYNV